MSAWTNQQEATLRALYPGASKDLILRVLPHSWDGIRQRAKNLGIIRVNQPARRAKSGIIGALIDKRRAAGISQQTLAARIGIDRRTLLYLEQGVKTPRLINLQSWCEVLGFKLTIVPTRVSDPSEHAGISD